MARIIAIDYGMKRTGIAVTDELQIIATALDTVETSKLFPFLEKYISENNIQEIVVGLPMRMHGEVGQLEVEIQKFIEKFKAKFPTLKIDVPVNITCLKNFTWGFKRSLDARDGYSSCYNYHT